MSSLEGVEKESRGTSLNGYTTFQCDLLVSNPLKLRYIYTSNISKNLYISTFRDKFKISTSYSRSRITTTIQYDLGAWRGRYYSTFLGSSKEYKLYETRISFIIENRNTSL